MRDHDDEYGLRTGRWIHAALDPCGAYGLWEGYFELEPFTDYEWLEEHDRQGLVRWENSATSDWYYRSRDAFRQCSFTDGVGNAWRPISRGVLERRQRERDQANQEKFQHWFDLLLPVVAVIVVLLLMRSCFSSSSSPRFEGDYDPDDPGYYVPHGY